MIMLKRIIDPPPALGAFLTARAKGASHEELKRLADEAVCEQERLNATRSRARDVRLIVDNTAAVD